MATANQKKKIEKAYTVKDITSDDLECAMINMFLRVFLRNTYLTIIHTYNSMTIRKPFHMISIA